MNNQSLLREAYRYASNSADPSTQNAAILTSGGAPILVAVNQFPLNVNGDWTAPDKYWFVEHAERNVLFKAAALGIRTRGLTMVSPWAACADCARGIIQAGIREVVFHGLHPYYQTGGVWTETVGIGLGMLADAGVRLSRVDAPVDGTPIRVGGVTWEP